MIHAFRRKPIADPATHEDAEQSMRRALGAGDLVMLAIGAVIGAGIFGAIGTAAAGHVPVQAWERFGLWLALGLVVYAAYGVRHSRLRATARG